MAFGERLPIGGGEISGVTLDGYFRMVDGGEQGEDVFVDLSQRVDGHRRGASAPIVDLCNLSRPVQMGRHEVYLTMDGFDITRYGIARSWQKERVATAIVA